jgi:ribonucleoside-diphosphate reductase beta chain
MSIFNEKDKEYKLDRKMFLDEKGGVVIARYDHLKYPIFEKLTEKQLGFFWRPQEIDITKDSKDFRDLTNNEQHIFTSNLRRQILLDSVQGRGPVMLLPIVSVPELEPWIVIWSAFEQIHSKSYSHIIRNVYPDPSVVFDDILNIKEVVDCAKDISKYYDDLSDKMADWQKKKVDIYELKKALWMCLHSINALEGIRFYVSFACSWAFAEVKKMEGNAKIIKLIARDEHLHLAGTQKILDILPSEDKDFAEIKKETKKECEEMFMSVAEQEKKWADYLFKDGSMIGLNAEILKEYIEWTTHKRMKAVDLHCEYKTGSNPLPWTVRWISGADVQIAPQESEISSYIVGAIKQDITDKTFENFKL